MAPNSIPPAELGEVKLVAFYLPQFHPVPENDLWWGRGFTEWTNVTKAQPQFRGHYQPHLPADLGFYDLRLREVRREQIAMAKQYGIDGFCYHYYWFSGKRLLERPLDDMLADEGSDMPFCLCWANENWSRRWDAAETEILIAQKYAPDDDLNFIKSLMRYFQDPRYIRIDGAPLLIVYRPQHLPDPKKSANIWRDYCRSVGIPKLQIFCALTHRNWDYEPFGFDGAVEFPPHNMCQPDLRHLLDHHRDYEGYVVDTTEVAEMYLARDYSAYNGYRGVFPSWDNTARRGRAGTISLNGTPENYEYWLARAIERTKKEYPGRERFVFINAWNEWAEGCHLEPDRKYGHRFLEATLRAKSGQSNYTQWTHVGVPQEGGRKKESRPSVFQAVSSAAFSLFFPQLKAQRDALVSRLDETSAERDSLSKRFEELNTAVRRQPTKERDLLIADCAKLRQLSDAAISDREALRAERDEVALQRDDLISQIMILAEASAERSRLASLVDMNGASKIEFNSSENLRDLRGRYLDLLESVLVGSVNQDPALPLFGREGFDPALRKRGLDWPKHALSMIGGARMRNFRVLIEQALAEGIPGDIVETGVWRGGACILARAVLAAYAVKDRRVILADSFEGLPPPDPRQYSADEGAVFHEYRELAVSDDEVRANFEKFGLFDEQVVFLKGWFRDTLPRAPCHHIAVLRLDGDLYESTWLALVHLFDKVSPGGRVIIDDYHWVPGCKLAVREFLAERKLNPKIREIDGVGVFFQK